jgi:2-methylisocitrate lyase-like PEP mutase family enzyme
MEQSNYQIFKQLHNNPEPLLLPNAWDAGSAKNFEASGFAAVATSSAALANALGYDDGEQLSFDELLFVVERICRSVGLPVSVDIEGGHSRNVPQICENIERLVALGVVGVNFEDSAVDGSRKLLDAAAVAETLGELRSFCRERKLEVFINLRTDTYLLDVENRFEETVKRIATYEKAGVDGIFIPFLTNPEETSRLCRKTALPINVMCMPDLPAFDELAKAGVKRISMGPFMYEFLRRQQSSANSAIKEANSFKPLFG